MYIVIKACHFTQERNLRETQDTRRSQSITDMVVTKEREKQLKFELNQTQEMLKHEQGRVKHYLEEVREYFRFLLISLKMQAILSVMSLCLEP